MKKKILILSPKFYPSLGGVEEQVTFLGQSFISFGYDVDVYTTKHLPSLPTSEIIAGMTVKRFTSVFGLFILLFKNRKKYDLILSRHYYKNSFILSIYKVLKIIKTTTVICADSGGENDEIKMIQKKWRILTPIYFWFIKSNDYLNCLNEDNKKHLEELLGPQKKIIKIYNGIDFGDTVYQKRNKIKSILFLSRIIKEKGIIETIEAFTHLKDNTLTLTIVGSGTVDDEESIKTLIAGDKRITYLGPLYGELKEKIFEESDLLVFPTYTEGQSVLLLEAIKYNIPVITTNVSDHKLLYGDQFIYIEKENINNLYDKLYWITQNQFDYNYTGIKQKLSISSTCKQFLKLIP